MASGSADQIRRRLLKIIKEQRAALATYKETLGRIYQEFDAKIEELSLIRRVSDLLRTAEDTAGLAQGLLTVVMDELPADFASLMLADAELAALAPVAMMQREWDSPAIVSLPSPGQQVELGKGQLGSALGQGRIVLLSPPAGQGLGPGPWPQDLPAGSQSLLALPLLARQQLLGAIILAAEAAAAFREEHTRVLTIMCDHFAASLVNVRLVEELGEINERLLASELGAHQAREHLQRLLDTASDLIILADREGRITYANAAATELGLDPGGLKGTLLAGLFADSGQAARLLSEPDRGARELILAPPGGSLYTTLVSTTPLPESGELLAIVRDITGRKALERQLVQAEKLASVGILAAGVAHEIGNPLSAISGYAQLLGKDDTSTEERREFAGSIAELTARIDRIIRDLLDYSRPSPYQEQTTEVNQAVDAVLGMFFTSKRLARRQLAIHRDLARGLPPVAMDRDQLMQVVLNMVMNAAQAMGPGGRLTIGTWPEAGGLAIAFNDTGPGIKPEHLPHIFDPFFTTKPPGQGTGLGLSICQRIVEQAGGRISVETAAGTGTTFTIWLPAAAAKEEETAGT